MIRRAAFLLSIVVSGGQLIAQPHDPAYLTQKDGQIIRVDGTGNVVRVLPNGCVAYLQGISMAADNRHAYVIKTVCLSDQGLALVDTGTGTSAMLSTLVRPTAIALNQDGDPTFVDGASGALMVRSGGKISTVASPSRGGFTGGLEVDIDTGHFVAGLRDGFSPMRLVEVSAGGSIRTLCADFWCRYTYSQDILTGDWYAGTDAAVLNKLPKGSSAKTVVRIPAPYYAAAQAIAFDRASSANHALVVFTNYRFLYFDVRGGVVLKTVPLNYGQYSPSKLAFDRGRNVCTVRQGLRRFEIRLSFPGHPNSGYVLGLSLSGVRPPVRLPDGRRIAIVPDSLTRLSLAGALAPLFNPGPMRLDANGEARATIDVTSLPQLSGVRVWIQAIVIPGRIGEIADPVGLNLP